MIINGDDEGEQKYNKDNKIITKAYEIRILTAVSVIMVVVR